MTLRTCNNGHQYLKTSDCPTCPVCEKARKPTEGMLALLSAPARRAFENAGVKDAKALSKFTEAEILKLHGVGKTSLPILRNYLGQHGLTFKEEQEATKILAKLHALFPDAKATLDLTDCDRVLRIEGEVFSISEIVKVVSEAGFICEVLE